MVEHPADPSLSYQARFEALQGRINAAALALHERRQDRGRERDAAVELAAELEPKLRPGDHLVFVVGAKCYGQSRQDIDLLIFADFHPELGKLCTGGRAGAGSDANRSESHEKRRKTQVFIGITPGLSIHPALLPLIRDTFPVA